jgi:hypothetical protein
MIKRWEKAWGPEVTAPELLAMLLVLVLLLRFAA